MRLLFVNSRPPWPPRRGDQARTAGWIDRLRERHAIEVVAQSWPGFVAAPPPPGVIGTVVEVGRPALAGRLLQQCLDIGIGDEVRPLQAALHDQARFHAAVQERVRRFRPHLAIVVLSRLGDVLPHLVRAGGGRLPRIIDLVDALSLNMRRRARREPALAPLWRHEAQRLARWDVAVASLADRALVVAERDRRAVLDAAEEASALAHRLEVVPFGLEIDAGDPLEAKERDLVVLTGNLGYFPTVEGARWFARAVWPRVRQRRPQARWLLAGARPSPALRALAGTEGIELEAEPPNLRAVLRRASVAVAPLRAGSGTPIKILEAMAEGVPMVATPSAVEGLDGWRRDDDEVPLLAVERDADAFAAAVSSLLEDRSRAWETARAARRWLRSRHGLDASARHLERLCEQVLQEQVESRSSGEHGLRRRALDGSAIPGPPRAG
ncbi:MAG: glycosyltransferase [Acidobacteriota bacterium]